MLLVAPHAVGCAGYRLDGEWTGGLDFRCWAVFATMGLLFSLSQLTIMFVFFFLLVFQSNCFSQYSSPLSVKLFYRNRV
jgi:hypothetical protein